MELKSVYLLNIQKHAIQLHSLANEYENLVALLKYSEDLPALKAVDELGSVLCDTLQKCLDVARKKKAE